MLFSGQYLPTMCVVTLAATYSKILACQAAAAAAADGGGGMQQQQQQQQEQPQKKYVKFAEQDGLDAWRLAVNQAGALPACHLDPY
jgi:hypothetical protein